jgi:RNA polymerase sigma factor (sigma-70 family)
MPSEDELYDRWTQASPEERPEIERQLYPKLMKHARAVVWMELEEENPDLVQEIVAAAMRLDRFAGKSKFSTWVQGIAKNQIKEELRSRTRRRRVIDENVEFDEEGEIVGWEPLDHTIDMTLEELGEGLSDEEKVLYNAMLDGKEQNEIAAELGTLTTRTVAFTWAVEASSRAYFSTYPELQFPGGTATSICPSASAKLKQRELSQLASCRCRLRPGSRYRS